ncbi:hypothetical protein ABLB69_05210 [Xenorhabdus khoisanae]|nr:hypothetical protein [Xenorhabdus khoisanae]
MNIEEIIASIKNSDIESSEAQVVKMESEEVSVLGPMNMLAFDI